MTDFLTRMSRAALGLMPTAQVAGASRYAPEMIVEEEPAADVPATQARVSARAPASPAQRRAMPAAVVNVEPLRVAVPSPESPAAPKEDPARIEAALPAVPKKRVVPLFEEVRFQEERVEEERVEQHQSSVIDRPARMQRENTRPVDIQPPSASTFDELPMEQAAISDSLSHPFPEPTSPAPRWTAGPVGRLLPDDITNRAAVTDASPAERTIPGIPAHPLRRRFTASEPLDVTSHALAIMPPTPAAPPPPIVRVTIGRIEVRPPAPPLPAPEPPSPAPPRLSLDDYLRSHGRSR